MPDRVFAGFLDKQLEQGQALAEQSDLLELQPMGATLPQHYLAHFRCKGLVRTWTGEIIEAEHFDVGVRFPDGYLRGANMFDVLAWFGPTNVWHPNISNRAPVICVGRLAPGTSLVDILYQVFEIITYTKVTMREDDALNPLACAWAREHKHLFPIDRRPLIRIAGATP
jgi:hypothetical protein